MLYSLFVLNKAGSLLFHADLSGDTAPRLPTNERITLASTFHGLSAIAGQLSPAINTSGIQVLEADSFRLQCYVAPTGIQFIVLASPGKTGLDSFLKKIYSIYADYVLKNPFYSLDMPIRCELFDLHLNTLVEATEGRSPSWRSPERA